MCADPGVRTLIGASGNFEIQNDMIYECADRKVYTLHLEHNSSTWLGQQHMSFLSSKKFVFFHTKKSKSNNRQAV